MSEIISKELFDQMKEKFNENIKPKLGDDYTDYVSVDIQELKNFISLAEKEAGANKTQLVAMEFHFIADSDSGQLTMAFMPRFSDSEVQGSIMDRHIFCPPDCGYGGN